MLAEQGFTGDEALLDWNESPLGPPPAAVRRVIDVAQRLHRYPRGLMEEVTVLAADYLHVSPRQVLLTSGVDEAVDIALSLAQRGWGTQPGFDGYEERVRANGKPFHPIPLGPTWQPIGECEGLNDTDIVFLAQPGNPTGNLLDPDWVRKVRSSAAYVFIDETYREFASGVSVIDDGIDDRLLVYRSFSKAMGLAGIRIGCLVADSDVIDRLAPVRRFMPIDAVSLSAAAGVLEDDLSFVKQLTAYVLEARAALAADLRASGLFGEVRDTEANFVVARLRPDTSEQVLSALNQAGIRVRSCQGLGLPDWIRVSVGSREDQHRLSTCLQSVQTTT